MKKIITILLVIVFNTITLAQKYEASELFVLSWGNENNQQLPYAYNDLGGFWGPFQQYVDGNENIYLAYPIKDFRKYDSGGELIFRQELNISNFAVDDLENVYFTIMDPDQHHILKVLDKNGILKNSEFLFTIDNMGQIIDCIKFKNGDVVISSFPSSSGIITNDGIELIPLQLKNPMDSKGTYYHTETSTARSTKNKQKSRSFGNNFINLLKLYAEREHLIKRDTISLNVCRFAHKSADVLHIDYEDNVYVRIYYDNDMPIDVVVLDSSLKEIDRIEMTAPEKTMGLSARPFVRPDGTIYEFRDLEDGLHVIRWSREE